MINNVVWVLETKFNFDFAETNGQPQGVGDCDLCFDFAHFIVKLYNT